MDTEYILGCAFEFGELTPLEASLLGSERSAYEAVRRMVDNDLQFPQDFLANTAHSVLQSLPAQARHLHALRSLDLVRQGQEFLMQRAQFVVQRTLQRNLGVASPAVALEGLSLDSASSTVRYVEHEAEISEAVVRKVLDERFQSLRQRWQRDMAAVSAALDWASQASADSLMPLLCVDKLEQAPVLPDGSLAFETLMEQVRKERSRRQQQEARIRKTLRQRARAAVKKATKLFETLGQRDNLSLFVSGHEVRLSNPDSPFVFIVKPLNIQGWLEDRTQKGRSHTPYELTVLTRDDVFLTNLCVYFNDTPVLDQLLALTLFITSGDELKLLKTANWYGQQDWTPERRQMVLQAYPELEDRLPAIRQSANSAPGIVLPDPFAREQAHWEPLKGRVDQWVGTWMEPVSQAVEQVSRDGQGLLQLMQEARNIPAVPELIAA